MTRASAQATGQSTHLLGSWRDSESRDQEKLIEIFYPWLLRAAAGMLREERHVSLAASDLVQEAFLRLIKLQRISYQDRAHFMALASKLMRRILIDHMRAKLADKRSHRRVTLVTNSAPAQRVDFQALNHALLRLGSIDPDTANIVEMRYFGGMSIADVASVTGLSEPTVQRRWVAARAWLLEVMDGSVEGS